MRSAYAAAIANNPQRRPAMSGHQRPSDEALTQFGIRFEDDDSFYWQVRWADLQ